MKRWIVFSLLLAAPLSAQTCSGGSNGICTVGSGKDFSTISACVAKFNQVVNGNTVKICDVFSGTYNENPTVNSGGNASQNIILQAHAGQSPKITGGGITSNVGYISILGFEVTGFGVGKCIFVTASGAGPQNVDIENNNIHECGDPSLVDTGIRIGSSSTPGSNATVKNNIIDHPESLKTVREGGTCNFNTTNCGSGGQGIQVWSDHSTVENNTVTNVVDYNTVYNSYRMVLNNTWGGTYCPSATGIGSPTWGQIPDQANCNIPCASSALLSGSGASNDSTNTFNCGNIKTGNLPKYFNQVHIDGVQFQPSGSDPAVQHLLVAGNTLTDSQTPNSHFALAQMGTSNGTSSHAIYRFNQATNVGSGGFYVGGTTGQFGVPNVQIYNNTLSGFNTITTSSCEIALFRNNSTNGLFVNNLLQSVVASGSTCDVYLVDTGATLAAGSNNLIYDPVCAPSCSYTTHMTDSGNVRNSDPKLVNPASDLHVLAGSPALAGGGPLTTVAGGGCSGNVINLVNPYPFQDGWGIAGKQPDWIAVGTVSNIVKISSGGINYSTGAVTAAANPICNPGDSVWLYRDESGVSRLIGAAPNIGVLGLTPTNPLTVTVACAGSGNETIGDSGGNKIGMPCSAGSVVGGTCTHGTITGDGTGCSSSTYNIGDTPVFTATATGGSVFLGWLSSDNNCAGQTCSPVITSNSTYIATATANPVLAMTANISSCNITKACNIILSVTASGFDVGGGNWALNTYDAAGNSVVVIDTGTGLPVSCSDGVFTDFCGISAGSINGTFSIHYILPQTIGVAAFTVSGSIPGASAIPITVTIPYVGDYTGGAIGLVIR